MINSKTMKCDKINELSAQIKSKKTVPPSRQAAQVA